eukprot:TRINITY_DN3511_c0_g1_i1.p1 TRINITY_DN3511_c0_g1~~TRINITY_DN3511_c0_g1_i1.p1  ORF type:complete len:268 (+),score=90.24 TRINITY_DN3511_c0_g1_i1:100-903(+)
MLAYCGLLCLLGVSLAAPLQDTPEVQEAKEQFLAAFNNAREGKHAALAPVNNDIQAAQIPNAYLDDIEPVIEAKSDFKIAFDTAEAGGLKYMQAEPVVAFYIAKTEEVAAAEDQFMKEYLTAEKGEHVKYAPVNNDIQAPQIDNTYIPYTQEVVDAADQFMTYYGEAKLKALAAIPAVEAAPAVAVQSAPAVAAVKSAPTVDAAKPAPFPPMPIFYNMPMVHGYPAFTYPFMPLKYFLLPVAPAAAVPVAAAAPEVAAEASPVVEEA